jgi:hypothetical protein
MKFINYSIITFIAIASVIVMFTIVAGVYTRNVQAVMTAIMVTPLFVLTSYMMMKNISLKNRKARKERADRAVKETRVAISKVLNPS